MERKHIAYITGSALILLLLVLGVINQGSKVEGGLDVWEEWTSCTDTHCMTLISIFNNITVDGQPKNISFERVNMSLNTYDSKGIRTFNPYTTSKNAKTKNQLNNLVIPYNKTIYLLFEGDIEKGSNNYWTWDMGSTDLPTKLVLHPYWNSNIVKFLGIALNKNYTNTTKWAHAGTSYYCAYEVNLYNSSVTISAVNISGVAATQDVNDWQVYWQASSTSYPSAGQYSCSASVLVTGGGSPYTSTDYFNITSQIIPSCPYDGETCNITTTQSVSGTYRYKNLYIQSGVTVTMTGTTTFDIDNEFINYGTIAGFGSSGNPGAAGKSLTIRYARTFKNTGTINLYGGAGTGMTGYGCYTTAGGGAGGSITLTDVDTFNNTGTISLYGGTGQQPSNGGDCDCGAHPVPMYAGPSGNGGSFTSTAKHIYNTGTINQAGGQGVDASWCVGSCSGSYDYCCAWGGSGGNGGALSVTSDANVTQSGTWRNIGGRGGMGQYGSYGGSPHGQGGNGGSGIAGTVNSRIQITLTQTWNTTKGIKGGCLPSGGDCCGTSTEGSDGSDGTWSVYYYAKTGDSYWHPTPTFNSQSAWTYPTTPTLTTLSPAFTKELTDISVAFSGGTTYEVEVLPNGGTNWVRYSPFEGTQNYVAPYLTTSPFNVVTHRFATTFQSATTYVRVRSYDTSTKLYSAWTTSSALLVNPQIANVFQTTDPVAVAGTYSQPNIRFKCNYSDFNETISLWKMDEGSGNYANDSTGIDADSSATGGSFTWNTTGHGGTGSALNFTNGDGIYASASASKYPSITYMSWGGWIYNKGISAAHYGALISKGWGNSGSWILYVGSDDKVVCGVNTGSGTECASTATFSKNTWTHVSCSFDGTNIRVFINGVINNTCAKTGVLGNAYDVIISNTGVNGFNGTVDDVFMSRTNLTATNFAQMYAGTWNWTKEVYQGTVKLILDGTSYNTTFNTTTGLYDYYKSNVTGGSHWWYCNASKTDFMNFTTSFYNTSFTSTGFSVIMPTASNNQVYMVCTAPTSTNRQPRGQTAGVGIFRIVPTSASYKSYWLNVSNPLPSGIYLYAKNNPTPTYRWYLSDTCPKMVLNNVNATNTTAYVWLWQSCVSASQQSFSEGWNFHEAPRVLLYWKMGEDTSTTYDFSENGITGTLQGSPTYNSSGKYGKGINFNGGQYVSGTLTTTTSGTWTAWIYKYSSDISGIIATDSNRPLIYTSGANFQVFWQGSTGMPVSNEEYTNAFPIPLNSWQFIAFSSNGTHYWMWMNSTLLEEHDFAPSTPSTTAIEVGRYSSSNYFNGVIDEVIILADYIATVDENTLYQCELRNWNY